MNKIDPEDRGSSGGVSTGSLLLIKLYFYF